jgi:hypothetical protein
VSFIWKYQRLNSALMLTKKVVYHLSCIPNHFLLFSYFSSRVSGFCLGLASGRSSYLYLPVAGLTCVLCVLPCPACFAEIGCPLLFVGLAFNPDLPDHHLPSNWDYRQEPLCPTQLCICSCQCNQSPFWSFNKTLELHKGWFQRAGSTESLTG